MKKEYIETLEKHTKHQNKEWENLFKNYCEIGMYILSMKIDAWIIYFNSIAEYRIGYNRDRNEMIVTFYKNGKKLFVVDATEVDSNTKNFVEKADKM